MQNRALNCQKGRKRFLALGMLVLLVSACSLGPTGTATRSSSSSAGPNPFGVLLAPQVINAVEADAILKELGVGYFRPPQSVAIDEWKGVCRPCDLAQQVGLKLVLTVRNSGGLSPSRPPADLQVYKKTLGEILDRYPPALLVVENEENSAIFYSGSPQQYGPELAAACQAAHARGIKCANGGLVGSLVALLVWDQYLTSGDAARAQDFASRAFDPDQQRLLHTPRVQEQILRGKALLVVYKTSGMDYVNFHWYIADTQALDEAVTYLKTQTGLPVITNEVGQFNDDPIQARAVMSELARLDLPIVIWFGMDGPKARGLMEKDGTLRPTGEVFIQFLREHYR